jgi:hypothetical protein
VTTDELFDYANKYARRKEALGAGTRYPTFRQVRRKFRVTNEQIEEVCASYCGQGYMGVGSGIRSGAGWAPINEASDWVVEAYE